MVYLTSALIFFLGEQAWIFEAFPTFGKVVGLRGKDTQIPRFVQYSFVKERRYPKDDEIKEVCFVSKTL